MLCMYNMYLITVIVALTEVVSENSFMSVAYFIERKYMYAFNCPCSTCTCVHALDVCM